MENKKADICYCGVSYINIRDAHPVINWPNMKVFHHFLIERYNIHKKKDVLKLPKPWTEDKILRKYKFTNVRREHDKQTIYLIDNIVKNDNLSLVEKILNIFLFRFWNNWDTMKVFEGPWRLSELTSENTKEKAREIYYNIEDKSPGSHMWFSNAYNQGGTKQTWKYSKDGNKTLEKDIPIRAFNMINYIINTGIINVMLKTTNQKDCFEAITLVPGYADFLAYQVFIDCTYIEDFPFSENEFVVAGPGCKRGLESLFDITNCNLTYEELLFWFRDNLDNIFHAVELTCDEVYNPTVLYDDLPYLDRKTNIMSLENLMCEFSKYIKAYHGSGRPRNTYEGE